MWFISSSFVFNGVTKISFFLKKEQWNILTTLKITNLLLQSNLIQACFGDFLDFYVGFSIINRFLCWNPAWYKESYIKSSW